VQTARNTVEQIPFPPKVSTLGDQLTHEFVNERAAGLHRWIRGVVRYAPEGAVRSFLYDDGSHNRIVDILATQNFMTGSEGAGMRCKIGPGLSGVRGSRY
jgi:hypothetical protein